MRPTHFAAADVYQSPPMTRYGAPFPWELFFAFFERVLVALTRCEPTPAAGYALLAWRPRPRRFLDWWFGTSPEERLADHRAGLERQMRRQWQGDPAQFAAFCDGLWDAIDSGKLTETRMAALYADVRDTHKRVRP